MHFKLHSTHPLVMTASLCVGVPSHIFLQVEFSFLSWPSVGGHARPTLPKTQAGSMICKRRNTKACALAQILLCANTVPSTQLKESARQPMGLCPPAGKIAYFILVHRNHSASVKDSRWY